MVLDTQSAAPSISIAAVPNQSSTNSFSAIQVQNPRSELVRVRLEVNNFFLWQQQILATLRGHGLRGFAYGTQLVIADKTL